MDLKAAEKFISKRVAELEQAVFMFDEILKPRADLDKATLRKLRDQQIKLDALMKKVKAGEQPSIDEFFACVPVAFRGDSKE
jgi:hypothetical protein